MLDPALGTAALYGTTPAALVPAALARLCPQPMATFGQPATGSPRDVVPSTYLVSDLEEAIDAVRRHCQLAVVTIGAEGCLIVTPDGVLREPAMPVDTVLDTTGAGDLFAAGFLYGHTRQLSLSDCARLGAIAAAEVISHVGPRPLVSLRTLLPEHLV